MQLRVCKVCGEEKELTEEFFYFRYHNHGKEVFLPLYSCKDCDKKAAVERGRKKEVRRRKHLNYLKLRFGCYMCGYNKHPAALDFHHIQGNKVGGVTGMLTCKLSKLMDEVRKCRVVCANCHRIIHAHKSA